MNLLLKKPLTEKDKKEMFKRFDSTYIWSGSKHWWATWTPKDKPSDNPKDAGKYWQYEGTEFTEGKYGKSIYIRKDGLEVKYVDNYMRNYLRKNGYID